MFFAYTIGFLAALGIIIPIAIHLWNVKEGKTLKIGSIALLGESSSQRSKSFKIKDWLLLLLRCLLIIFAAFLIAQPFIKRKLSSTQDKGWILVKPENLKQVYQQYPKKIDSLLAKGFELHALDLGFKAMSLEDTVSNQKVQNNLPISSLIKQLNSQLPTNFKVLAFADAQLNSFKDGITPTHLELDFYPIFNQDSTKTKVVDAYFSYQDSIKVLVMNSTPTSTNIQLVNYQPYNSSLELKTEEGKSLVKLKNQENWTAVDDEVLEIAIYAPAKQDANYLNAALNAIKSYSQRRINIQKVNNAAAISTQSDWVFWLLEEPFPNTINLKEGAAIFSYTKGKADGKQSFLKTGFSFQNSPKIYQSILAKADGFQKIWTDGFGNPLLSLEQKNNKNIYYFNSRLNPQWSDLVWSETFVKSLMPLILSPHNHTASFGFEPDLDDQRQMLYPQELFPTQAGKSKIISSSVPVPLENWFWIVGFFILVLERILTFKKQGR